METYPEMNARIKELERQLLCEETCTWKYDGRDCWETECDHLFHFIAGGPKEDGFDFCPYCGSSIVASTSYYSDYAWGAMTKIRQGGM